MTEPIEATAAEYFANMVDTYDSLIHRCVPRYEEMSERLLEYVPAAPKRILELGCGTGNHTLRFAARWPDAELVYLDAAAEMLRVTGHRLAAANRTGRAVHARFEELASRVDGQFDLVSSCAALHHVADKPALYATIATVMRPGGTFCLADQMAGATAHNDGVNHARFVAFCRQPGNLTPEELDSLLVHAEQHDHYTPVAEHFELLRQAGFESADCVWRDRIWGIVTATRRGG